MPANLFRKNRIHSSHGRLGQFRDLIPAGFHKGDHKKLSDAFATRNPVGLGTQIDKDHSNFANVSRVNTARRVQDCNARLKR